MNWTDEQERFENEDTARFHRAEGGNENSLTPECAGGCGRDCRIGAPFIGNRFYCEQCWLKLTGKRT